MKDAYICDAVRTPVGRYGGSLAMVRTDDLAAIPLRALMERNKGVEWGRIDDVLLGCANQAGEDNRNVARMALLLAGYPLSVPGATINRLCGSGMDAVGTAARAIISGEAEIIIAGGVENMSRSPYVMGKASGAFGRDQVMYDTTMGWRFVNPLLEKMYGADSMMETAENIASKYKISREEQDRFALWSQDKAGEAQRNGSLAKEIVQVVIPQRKGEPVIVSTDEHPRSTTLEKLAALKPVTKKEGTITAGNASGINDGAAALIIASETAVMKYGLTPRVKILGMATAGVEPGMMGMGPVPATRKLLDRLSLKLDEIDIIELNEAFAAQALGCIKELGLKENDTRINRLGGAIALGHPLGMSGARLVTSAFYQMVETDSSLALCTMCIGVGQGIALIMEKV